MTAQDIKKFLAESTADALQKHKEATGMNGHYIAAQTYKNIFTEIKLFDDVEAIESEVLNMQIDYDIDYKEYCLENPGYVMHNASIKSLACRKVLKFIENDKN